MSRTEANNLLDLVRAGHPVPYPQFRLALWVTGDLSSDASRGGE